MSEFDLINLKMDIIQKNQEKILLRLDELALSVRGINPADYIDSLEVMKILNRSASTLFRRRKKGILVPRLIGGNFLYYAPDIYKIRDEYLK